MAKIASKEVDAGKHYGKTVVYINWRQYGSTGRHWFDILGNRKSRSRYGQLIIDRIAKRVNDRRDYAVSDTEVGGPGGPSDRDECPGAMFARSNGDIKAHCRVCDASTNRMLGSDIKTALTKCDEWTVVVFIFSKPEFDKLAGKILYSK